MVLLSCGETGAGGLDTGSSHTKALSSKAGGGGEAGPHLRGPFPSPLAEPPVLIRFATLFSLLFGGLGVAENSFDFANVDEILRRPPEPRLTRAHFGGMKGF